jgi:hypothetical protein
VIEGIAGAKLAGPFLVGVSALAPTNTAVYVVNGRYISKGATQ